MAGFNENIRVKLPALAHLTRIGYTYRSLHSLHLDPETNIDTDTFARKLREFNPDLTDEEITLFVGKIRVMLNNEDLGREFYGAMGSGTFAPLWCENAKCLLKNLYKSTRWQECCE